MVARRPILAPFTVPDLVRDFRLPRVKSINTSGHKFGLAPLGVGWIVWRDAAELPEELIFEVNQLGGSTGVVLIASLTSGIHTGWRPDAWGLIAFLISSVLAVVADARRHELWDPLARPAHGTVLNLVGSIAFGISAIGAYVIPSTGELRNELWANAGTFLGALCFLAAALLARRNIEPDEGVRV